MENVEFAPDSDASSSAGSQGNQEQRGEYIPDALQQTNEPAQNMEQNSIDNNIEEVNELRSDDRGEVLVAEEEIIEIADVDSESNLSISPTSAKKRKRVRSSSPFKDLNQSADEDGAICPICLDHWEISGPHRPSCLKCGHLFGHACIKRWLQDRVNGAKCCPTCKAKASMRELRFIYAKAIRAKDNTEECRLRALLDIEKTKNSKLEADCSILKLELAVTKDIIGKLETDLERLRRLGEFQLQQPCGSRPITNYKLFMEKNIEISKDPGCRVLLYGKNSANLMVSQKSAQILFPGYGVRYIDVKSFKPTNFLHMSGRPIRDLCFNSTEDLLVSATLDKSSKLFNIHDRTVVSVFSPSLSPLWACSIDKESNNFLYLGSQQGTVYIYDVRNPNLIVEEFRNEADPSPVLNICPVHTSNTFPFGGFLVCKLKSVWFYEYLASQLSVLPTLLNVEGPFVSMSYNADNEQVLISTRPSARYVQSRYIVGNLTKLHDVPMLHISVTFLGSKVTPVMSRSAQIVLHDNTLIAAYLQDAKLLSVWDLRGSCRVQSLPVTDVVYDTCAVYQNDDTFLAALTETKCRIYKVNITED